MEQPNPDMVQRALEAIDQAPRTETGIIIPPHVAAAKQAARDAAAREEAIGPQPNRAQRRQWEKMRRRAAKRRHA